MKRKKLACFVLALALGAAALTGCSQGETEQSSAPESTASQTESQSEKDPKDLEAKLTFWGAWAPEQGPAKWIEEFNKEYPGIEIEYVKFTNTDEGNVKIDTSLMAGTDVDVFINFGAKRLQPRAEKGLVTPLNDLMEQDGFSIEEEYGEGAHQLDGQYYALPIGTLSDFVMLNQDALEKANLEVPTEWDLDTYKEYAQKLTSGEGASRVYGTCDWVSCAYWAMPAYSQLGSDPWYNEEGLSNWDDPAYKTALEFKNEMENTLQIQYPYQQLQAQKITVYDVFFKDQCLMTVATSGATRMIIDEETYPHDFKVTFAPMPVIDTEDNTNGNNGTYFFSYLSMCSKLEGEKKQAAWEFMKWLGTEGNTMIASVGHIPAWKNADKDQIINIMLGDNAEELVDLEAFKSVVLNDERAKNQDITNLTAYNQLYTIMQEEAELALYGEKSIDDALASMKSRSDEEIQKAS